LNISPAMAAKIVSFLLEHGLCVQKPTGEIVHSGVSTHVGNDSPHVIKHHQNWRVRGMQRMDTVSDEALFFTGPMALSVETAAEIRKLLPTMIEQIMKIVGPSPSEAGYCLNIDWFEY
jgi:hypothetical protein